jgi:membrane protein
MDKLVKIESWLINKVNVYGGLYLRTLVAAYADYRHRHLNEPAAAISFYAIFSVFPLLAFTAYLVGVITGKGDSQAATMVMGILTDFVPSIEGWIKNGLFAIVKGKNVDNWVNAILLAWAAHGFFQAANSAVSKVPDTHEHKHKSHLENIFYAAITLTLFSGILAAVVYTEFVSSAKTIPYWILPTKNPVVEQFLYQFTKSGALLVTSAILFTAILYYILIPYALRIRYALLGALLFAGTLIMSRTFYWVYLHYNKGTIENVYGAFSTLILIMLWVHFISNCFVFSCLYAYHLDQATIGKTETKKHKHAA